MRSLNVRVKISSDGVRADNGNLTDFPNLLFECFCFFFRVAQTAITIESMYTCAVVAVSLKLTSSCIASVCRASGKKGQLLFLVIPSQKNEGSAWVK